MATLRDTKCKNCPTMISREARTGLCIACYKLARKPTVAPDPTVVAPALQVTADRDKQRTTMELSSLKARYQESLKVIAQQESDLRTMQVLEQGVASFQIQPKTGHGTSEGTVVIVASDWHSEEIVGAEMGGLNTYNLDIAQQRATKFFQSALRLVRLLDQDITITTIVLALLGDFITNEIHGAENAESNELAPTHAIVRAQNMLIAGIEFLLAHTKPDVKFVLPCHSGNHARMTLKTRFASENGHSLEYLMYLHLAAYFRTEARLTFIIPEGMHSYLDVYGTTVRFHHGHAIKYGGGVGGIYIPTNKAIAQWNQGRHADLDVFGHFHQQLFGGTFIANGSLIGYNAFALSIKASFEKPKQTLFLLDKKRGLTCQWPILVEGV